MGYGVSHSLFFLDPALKIPAVRPKSLLGKHLRAKKDEQKLDLVVDRIDLMCIIGVS